MIKISKRRLIAVALPVLFYDFSVNRRYEPQNSRYLTSVVNNWIRKIDIHMVADDSTRAEIAKISLHKDGDVEMIRTREGLVLETRSLEYGNMDPEGAELMIWGEENGMTKPLESHTLRF